MMTLSSKKSYDLKKTEEHFFLIKKNDRNHMQNLLSFCLRRVVRS